MLRWGVAAATAGAVLALLAGYGGALHPVGDSLAVFRAEIALAVAALSALCLAVTMRALAAVALLAAVAAGLPIFLSLNLAAGASDANATLYQKNLSFRIADLAPVEADIRAVAPDFLTLQEVTAANAALLDALADTLPGRQLCPFATVGGVAVASRWPKVAGSGQCLPGLAAMQVEAPRGPVWAVSVHLHWPWPYGQAEQVQALLPLLRGLDGPVVMAGDFNMVPWSHTLRSVAAATGATLAGPARRTFPLRGGRPVLAIDHALTPYAGETTIRPLLGSDHHGLVARFAL